jgi:RHS repeat-associated protein
VLRDVEYLSTGWRWVEDYVHGSTGLLATLESVGGEKHYHLDHLGSPRLVTNLAKQVVARHVLAPYGEELTSTNQDELRMKFTGHERDTMDPFDGDGDLDYMHARHHSPLTGRFLSVDRHPGNPPRPQTWNRYAYVTGNPLKKIDPNGLAELSFTLTTFISAPTVAAPSFSGARTFAGDNRTFSTNQNSYRTQQSFRIETDPAKASNPLLSQRNVPGRTVELNRDGSVKNTGLATSVGSAAGSRDAQGNAVIQLTTDSKNPLVAGAPAIDNSLTISASPSGNSVAVSGTLDGFPSVLMTVANEQGKTLAIIQFDPTAVGNNAFSLFPGIGDQSVNVQCSGVSSGAGSCSASPQ